MYPFLIAVIAVLGVLLVVIILIQSGKGGGLAASFGGASSSTDSFMGGRQAATALTRMTWVGGGLFLFLALVLAVLSARPSAAPQSILRGPGGQTALPEAPPSLLESPPAADSAAAADTGAATDAGAASRSEGTPPASPDSTGG